MIGLAKSHSMQPPQLSPDFDIHLHALGPVLVCLVDVLSTCPKSHTAVVADYVGEADCIHRLKLVTPESIYNE